jgi:hypothetical protein
MIEFNRYRWKCPICGLRHRVRMITQDGEYIKRCKCGGWARLKIIVVKSWYTQPYITSAEDT